ncbi:FAD-binding oxidoreductase [Nonomuraea cavernae]|uniref:FAD-linked oxidase n=1 Tax=Nonomuraea cavernae TaxID=2045107 RepID=A0A917YPQ0_9ACTN|nr:FAD-binding oxidoreductase [Nonomuraea cavernae]GGO63445.1 FAD-linked oxidase [Nonomuraea cavernae]
MSTTSAPSTSAPSTSAPSTSAPSTSAPSTSAPSTSAPSTSGPAITDAAGHLRGAFDGNLHLPGDERYDAERLAWNRALDPHPALVAEAAHVRDVRAAVMTAREHGLPFAVQATGHGTHVPADGGLLLKTSRLAAVHVDPERRTARAEPGALWSDVIAAAAPYGLAPLSGTPAIGVTGYTLGGGTGWLSRLHGYAADNLLRAELVTAGGETVTAGPAQHPELFWALRGGGGNFGVVTALEFRLHPVAEVYAGMTLHSVDRAAATLARYREWAPAEPDELNTSVILMRTPGPDGWALAVRACHAGPADEGRRLLAPLLEAAGPVTAGGFATMTFGEAATAFGGPAPQPMAVRQHLELLHQVPDDVIETVLAVTGSPIAAVELRHWGGAMARPAPDAGPVGHRDVPYSVIATAMPDGPGDPALSSLRDLAAGLRPHATGGSFLNFLTDTARTRDAYTVADHERLTEVKRAWDPGNLFGRTHNIPPA